MGASEREAPILRLLALVSRRIEDELHARQTTAGFTEIRFAHGSVFAHLPPEGIHLSALANRAGMTKQAMSELVADLERLGYVERRPDPSDRRAKIIEFTDSGWSAVDAALTAFTEIEAAIAERIGVRQFEQFRGTVLAILDTMPDEASS